MQYFVALFAAALMSACVARVPDDVGEHQEAFDSCGDAAECAIGHFEESVGKLSPACAEIVRATTIDVLNTSDMYCFGSDPTSVLGCMVDYSHEGAHVLVRNVGTRIEQHHTAVHELTHVALRCARGDVDASHSRYSAVWHGLM